MTLPGRGARVKVLGVLGADQEAAATEPGRSKKGQEKTSAITISYNIDITLNITLNDDNSDIVI